MGLALGHSPVSSLPEADRQTTFSEPWRPVGISPPERSLMQSCFKASQSAVESRGVCASNHNGSESRRNASSKALLTA